MSNNIFIKHHLGMGDCIVHNGMVRKIQQDKNCIVTVASKYCYIDNVKFMYRDNKNINVIGVNNDHEVNQHISQKNYDEVVSTHHDGGKLQYDIHFDDAFYYLAGLNPDVKTSHFHLERDENLENKVYSELITKNKIDKYIFIHEKINENILVDRKKINKDLPLVFADTRYSIFELLKVIENAEECHIISSSFLSLFTCRKYNINVYAHMYADRLCLKDYIIKNGISVIL